MHSFSEAETLDAALFKTKAPLLRLRENWKNFEKLFLSVAEYPDFDEFLATYRGHSAGFEVLQQKEKCDLFLSALIQLLRECFLSEAIETEIIGNAELKVFESAINTALYYWNDQRDRNFQFRTVVHFLGLPSESRAIDLPSQKFNIQVSEWGIGFSLDHSFSSFPQRTSIARVCGLKNLKMMLPLSAEDSTDLFVKTRLLQREFCLLIDEWEHCNSILAVQQFSLRKYSQSESEMAQLVMRRISETRNGLARWCAESAADFQKFVGRARSFPLLNSDILSELQALDALLLSGFQKFLLPGSVSRHLYTEEVIVEYLRWTRERITSHQDDLFAHVAELSFSVALNEKADISILIEFISGRSFDWLLSADPSAVVKSVCWGMSSEEHCFFTALLVVILDAKLAPQILDSHWLQTIAGLVEMSGTFPQKQKLNTTLVLDSEVLEQLNQRALEIIERCLSRSRDDALKAALFVQEFLNSALHKSGMFSIKQGVLE